MKRLQVSGRQKTIESIWDWYEYHLRLSLLSKVGIQTKIVAGDPDVDARFYGMTLDEIDRFFRELDYLVMFDLMAATEAVVRLEYWTRVDNKHKDALSRALRKLYRQKSLQVKLDDDLLDLWSTLRPTLKDTIGDFKGALKFRHWLAHGRYWETTFARDYAPGDVFDICYNLRQAIEA